MCGVKGKRVKGKSKESRDFNLALDNIKTQIIKHYQRISDREAFVTAEMVRNAYQGMVMGYVVRVYLRRIIKNFKRHIGTDRTRVLKRSEESNEIIW